MIYVPRKTLETYPRFNTWFIRRGPNGELFKMVQEIDVEDCSYVSCKTKEFLKYVYSLPNIKGLLQPNDILYDSKGIYGYKMNELQDGQVIGSSELTKTLLEEHVDIMGIIKELFLIIARIHQYFVFNDVRNSNIVISSGQPYFIDWERGHKKDDKSLFNSFYNPLPITKPEDSSQLIDITKVFISALSLYYGMDVENGDIKAEWLLEQLKCINANKYIIDYLRYLIELHSKNVEIVPVSFAEYTDYITLPTKEEKEHLARLLHLQH